MLVNKSGLLSKMWITPRLTLRCDGEKIKCRYISNEDFRGWVLEDESHKVTSFKGMPTKAVVMYIFDNYKEVHIIWSRKVW
ncbi:hypothetical protein [Clostridium sp.]|uniref:hypothetical protein n=1 Tax=Clostridium sp. TaxID=1506 RepID=UPI003217A736